MNKRMMLWEYLSRDWKIDNLEEPAQYCTLNEIGQYIEKILQGNIKGRVVIEHNN